jgi:hypothetical protein
MKASLFIGFSGLLLTILTTACSQDNKDSDFIIDPFTYNDPSEEIIALSNGDLVAKRYGLIFYEGDICLTAEQYDNLDRYNNIFGENISEPTINRDVQPTTNMPLSYTRNLGVSPTGYNLWAMVRFVYDSNLTAAQRSAIKIALKRIESNTNVRFYNATGQPTHDDTYNFDYPYINFKYYGTEDTSNSYVGHIGGKQDINLAAFAFYSWNTHVIEHEICHALGMFHEQCRNDRDSYVVINTSNLTDKGKTNFTKQTKDFYYIGSYDFNSVMGYSSYTSSTSMVNDVSEPMYTKIDGSAITQGTKLSDLDRSWLNNFYLPYIARSDTYAELDSIVYDSNNNILSEEQRLQLQAQLNNGNPNPPANGRIENDF